MRLQRNYYEVLGLPQEATCEQIKKKYRELARQFHPDLIKDKAHGQAVFSQINQAYQVLRDTERRARYDYALPLPSRQAAAALRPVAPASSPGAMRLLAEASEALRLGKYANARSACLALLQREPDHAGALEILGDAACDLGQYAEAAALYRRALQTHPSAVVRAKLQRLR